MKIKLTLPFPQRKRYLRFIMRTFVFLFCTTVFSLSPITDIFGQNTKITIDADKTISIYEVFDLIRSQTEFTFIYQSDIFKNTPKIHLKKGIIKANELLEKSLATHNFIFALAADKSIVVKPKTATSVIEDPVKVTGNVTDEAGMPLAGVTVRISGTNKGVATNFDGNYTIIAPSTESVLVFSSLGFATKEIIVGDQTVIDVTMQEAQSQLDEIIINAGYYNVTERERTGSISKISAKIIEKQPVNNPLAAMQGHLAGVNITETSGLPGSAINIQIRGQNSIQAGNDPLYVVDGVPYSSESLGSQIVAGNIFQSMGAISPLNAINPADIESIEVLKDADATAIYGSRGANGVVLITTKKGKAGKTKINVNLSSSLGNVSGSLDLLNTEQYLEMRLEGIENDGISAFLENPFFDSVWPDVKIWDQNRYTDWQREFIGNTAYRNNVQLSFSGGSNQTQFLLSGGYQNQTTVFPGDSNYDKISAHTNINHQSTDDRLKINLSLDYVSDKNKLPGSDFTRLAYTLAPNAPALYDDEGNLNWENSTWTNPLAILEEDYTTRANNLIANAVLSYQLFPNLKLKTNLGYNDIRLEEYRTRPHTIFDPAKGFDSSNSIFFTSSGSRSSWIVEPQLNWEHKWGDLNLNILVGTTFQQEKSQKLSQSARGFSTNALIFDLSAANTIFIQEDDNIEYNYSAVFGRLNLNWKDRYILNITGRRDGSSRFGPGKQFGNFGAIGAAWLFSEENFLKNNSILSFGKLRGSFGTTGNDRIENYKFLDTYSSSGNIYNGVNGLNPTQLFNPNFAWEENKKLEAALELGFCKDRIFVTAAWYRNRSSNQLVNTPLPGTTGFSGILQNFDATVENTGFEIDLRSVNFQNDHFTWTTTFNITVPKNELISFSGLESSTYADQYIIGEPLSVQQLYHFTGVDTDTGIYQFEDFNNDGAINLVDDRQLIDDLDPKFYGGLGNSLIYKNLQLDFFFQFKKQKAYNLGANFPGAGNQSVSVLNRWQEVGDERPVQRYSFGFNPAVPLAFNQYNRSDASLTDASFIRLRNVSISYNIPRNVIKGMDASIYLQGQNLLTITNYEGTDPEQPLAQVLPPLRQFTLGLNLSF